MLVDSVFSPILQFAEQPLIPASQIERTQRRIETRYGNEMTEALEAETQRYLDRMDDALADQDVRAINASQWPAASVLQRIIFELWTDAFALGGEQGIEEMRTATSDVREFSRVRRFAVPLDVQRDIEAIFELETPQLINTDAVEAVVGRSNLLAGDFADDVFLDLRKHLVAAIVPQADTGNPISRSELLERIRKTLSVGEVRARAIAATELNYAYNQGRRNSFNESDLVDYIRIIVVNDDRLSDICRSRLGLIVPKNEMDSIGGWPPYHVHCRTTGSPVMSRLSRFREMVEDSTRVPANRELVPLPRGWRS